MISCKRLVQAAAMGLALALLPTDDAMGSTLTPHEAHARASQGQILLVDVRHPREWRQTGIGTSATPISMHQPGFLEKLAAATGRDKSRPVALICASGGRSARLQQQLAAEGYTNVLHVAEGMVGGRHGPGWLKTGLPVKSP